MVSVPSFGARFAPLEDWERTAEVIGPVRTVIPCCHTVRLLFWGSPFTMTIALPGGTPFDSAGTRLGRTSPTSRNCSALGPVAVGTGVGVGVAAGVVVLVGVAVGAGGPAHERWVTATVPTLPQPPTPSTVMGLPRV